MERFVSEQEASMVKEYFPDIEISRKVLSGFRSRGWAVYVESCDRYVGNSTDDLVVDTESAEVFVSLITAIAVCKTMQYFHCSGVTRVVAVID